MYSDCRAQNVTCNFQKFSLFSIFFRPADRQFCLHYWPSDRVHGISQAGYAEGDSYIIRIGKPNFKNKQCNETDFGGDEPFGLMCACAAMYDAMPDGEVAKEQKAMIMGGNVLGLLGLGE